MKRICAWCNKELPSKPDGGFQGEISHGICSQCIIKVTSFKPRTAKQLLDFLEEPVFLIDEDGAVKVANKSGLKMLGKQLADIENELGGDAFECTYAGEEGGCGRTVHCRTCAIRNIVMDTLATGRGYSNVPAFQSINTSDGPKILRFLISTQKVADCILLRIDKVIDKAQM